MAMTDRLALPLMASGQAGKEMTVNEALALVDIAVQPVVSGIRDTPPASPAAGESWVVGTGAAGAWAGQAGAIAGWTSGGWRFVPMRVGMTAWDRSSGTLLRCGASGWTIPVAVAAPVGGTMADVQARATLAEILGILRSCGLVRTAV